MFLVCFGYMLDIVIVDTKFMHKFVKHLAQDLSELNGRYYLSVVLICCLPTGALYILSHVVDRECDTLIESFVVHSPNIGQVGSSCEGSHLIFLSNIPYV